MRSTSARRWARANDLTGTIKLSEYLMGTTTDRAAQTTHIKSIAVFFHPMEQIEVASGKFNMVLRRQSSPGSSRN